MKSKSLSKTQEGVPLNARPYQFTILSTHTIMNDPNTGPDEKTTYGYLMDNLSPNYITLVDIDKNLIPLMEATDNEIFYRPLFLNNLFINCDFHFGKYIVKGIYIYELKPFDKAPLFKKFTENSRWGEAYSELNITFMSYVADIKDQSTIVIPGVLVNDPNDHLPNGPELKIKNHIRRYICNILDFVNNGAEDELKIITVEASEKRNKRRAKKGKLPQPTVIHIRPRKEFLKFANEFNKNSKKKAGHKYQVRGHFRHFKNKRYSEERRSKPKWITPYYKGEGIYIKKSYQLNGE